MRRVRKRIGEPTITRIDINRTHSGDAVNPKFSKFLVAMLAGLMVPLLSVPALALDVIDAGAPQPLVKNRDYANLFSTLEQNKIDGFFPTFQYQEIPTPKSFGHEKDIFRLLKSVKHIRVYLINYHF